jgi:hypothetical protein
VQESRLSECLDKKDREPPPGIKAMSKKKSTEAPDAGEIKQDDLKEFLPPLDFSSIVFPFYTQALVKLGLMEDPLKSEIGENLDFAKRLIDILDLLKTRTQGQLQPDEKAFIESCLAQLKMSYMTKANIIKL